MGQLSTAVSNFISTVFGREQKLRRELSLSSRSALSINQLALNQLPGIDASIFGSLDDVLGLDRRRLYQYSDYEQMDDYPDISAILDIYSDDSTQTDSSTRQQVWIECQHEDVRKDLENMFYKNLRIGENIWEIARETCKYGNNFEEIIVGDMGVVGLNHLPVATVHRIEAPGSALKGFVQSYATDLQIDPLHFDVNQFRGGEKTSMGGNAIVYDDWRVAHFRLKSKSREAIYGVSIAEPARWVWKRLTLLEDAVMVYKLVRSPSRYLFTIDVSGLSTKEAERKLMEAKQRLKKRKFIDPNTGKPDFRFSPLCLSLGTQIPLLDGREVSLSTLIEEYKAGKKNWTYSMDWETKKVVPGEIEWAGITRENAELVEVELDNGKKERVTPDHRFFLRDGTVCKAEDLKPGQSLAPLYRYKHGKKNSKHEYLVHLDRKNHFESTHWAVVSELGLKRKKGFVIDHIDNNALNNNPNNLRQMTEKDHYEKHIAQLPFTIHTQEAKQKSIETRRYKRDTDKEWVENHKRKISIGYKLFVKNNPEKVKEIRKNQSAALTKYNKSSAHSKIASEINKRDRKWEIARRAIDKQKQAKAAAKACAVTGKKVWTDSQFRKRKSSQISRDMKEWWNAYRDWKKSNIDGTVKEFRKLFGPQGKKFVYKNHKVVAVRRLSIREDTGCITVRKWHNFALSSCVFVHNSFDEDFFVGSRDGKDQTRVDVLNGPAYQQVEDVEYFLHKLYACMKVPRAYMGDDSNMPSKATLSSEDAHFGMSVLRIQNELRNGLHKVGRVHLAARNIDPASVDFNIIMTVPSAIFELGQMEVRRARAELASSMERHVSLYWLLSNIYGLSDDDISGVMKQKESEMKKAQSMGGGSGFESVMRNRKGMLFEPGLRSLGNYGVGSISERELMAGDKEHEKRLEEIVRREMHRYDSRIGSRLRQTEYFIKELVGAINPRKAA